ncbi:Antibiotic biosynthesis monooxygenase [Arthrobacter sp. FB24]|jgi:quinol monooxygenase YgiN|uniref:putative quinol monooxygenase n=1 Tax=Arthrobacter sp. (strain FB24) TaxID=290399 RepID=UPI00005277F5|nr:antibiotic biosynthesis monooxygenase [Arthrobacter sp. FB24]ABK03217.1 Antibiotic biosynthesis monooxygenase [Arthrobacter sp. FB24]
MNGLVVVVSLSPANGHREKLLAVCRKYWPGVQEEPGCELFALHEGPESFMVIERWSSRLLWEQHLATADNAALNAELAPLLAEPANVWPLTAVPIGDKSKAIL